MTIDSQSADIWGIIPAAGQARRMGIVKQTLPYHETTVTGAVVRTLLDADVATVILVTRSNLVDCLDLPQDRRVRIAINDDAESEMIDSIRIGLQAALGAGKSESNAKLATDGILVVPGDMPKLNTASCRACIEAFGADPQRIVIATNAGQRGHPIIFPASMLDAISELRQGLRELAERFSDIVRLVEVSDSGVTQDVDTPADYETL